MDSISDCESWYSDSPLHNILPVSTVVAKKEKQKIKATAKAVKAAQTYTNPKKSKGAAKRTRSWLKQPSSKRPIKLS